MFAGGEGARLVPYTRVLPKPLLPVGDRPVLEIIIGQLREAGITEVVLATGYLSSLIETYFGDGRAYGVEITYMREKEQLGTVGALATMPEFDDTFVMMNGDVLTTPLYTDLLEAHRKSGAAATVASKKQEVDVEYGVLRLGDDIGELRRIDGIDEKPRYYWPVSMGIYAVEPRVQRFVEPGRRMDLPELLETHDRPGRDRRRLQPPRLLDGHRATARPRGRGPGLRGERRRVRRQVAARDGRVPGGGRMSPPTSQLVGEHSSPKTIRAFDLIVAALLLPFAIVLGLAIAILIFIDSPGPIFFHSRRVGLRGEPFDMLKFRKMRRDAEGPALTKYRDDRLTPIGGFLVATKLDELPQLWNVLRGQMSLVGPRPEVEEFVALYPEEYEQILTVVPGITGPAQLEYVEERHLLADAHESSSLYAEEILPRKIAVDLAYIHEQTLRRDLAILVHTALLPLRTAAERLSQALTRVPTARAVLYGTAGLGVIALVAAFTVAAGPIR